MEELEQYASDPELNGLKKDGSSVRVLIVDDSLAIRRLLRRILESTGYMVVGEASNGKEALAVFEYSAPDVVVLDIVMPDMDGIEVLKLMKAKRKNVGIVMLTSLSQRDTVEEAIRSGASDYIVKPVIKDRIRRFLAAVKKASAVR